VRYTCENVWKSREKRDIMRSANYYTYRSTAGNMRIMCFARITSFELSLLNPPLRLFKINHQSLAGYGWRKERKGKRFYVSRELDILFSRGNSFRAAISLVWSPFGARPRARRSFLPPLNLVIPKESFLIARPPLSHRRIHMLLSRSFRVIWPHWAHHVTSILQRLSARERWKD